ncbi:unnamed protein product, partial [Mesorhabditis spiculigera]
MAEKIGYQTTILLSVCFFLTVLSEMTPNTSEALPLIGIFFSTVTVILSCSTAFTITVLSLRYRQPANHQMTSGMRKLFLEWLPWLLMMYRPGHRFKCGHSEPDDVLKEVEEGTSEPDRTSQTITEPGTSFEQPETILDVLCDVPTEKLLLERKVGDGIFYTPNRQASIESRRSVQLEKYLKKCVETSSEQRSEEGEYAIKVYEYFAAINAQLKRIRGEIEKNSQLQEVMEEWKFAAMCLDRLCLVVFSSFLCTSIFVIFYSAPYLNA